MGPSQARPAEVTLPLKPILPSFPSPRLRHQRAIFCLFALGSVCVELPPEIKCCILRPLLQERYSSDLERVVTVASGRLHTMVLTNRALYEYSCSFLSLRQAN